MTTRKKDINNIIINEGDLVKFTSILSLDRKEGTVKYNNHSCIFFIKENKISTSIRGREGTNYYRTYIFDDVKDILIIGDKTKGTNH